MGKVINFPKPKLDQVSDPEPETFDLLGLIAGDLSLSSYDYGDITISFADIDSEDYDLGSVELVSFSNMMSSVPKHLSSQEGTRLNKALDALELAVNQNPELGDFVIAQLERMAQKIQQNQ